MIFMTPADRALAESISKLNYCNPFLPERIEFEREALGERFVFSKPAWSRQANVPADGPNVPKLILQTEALCHTLLERLQHGARPAGDGEVELYEDSVYFLLFHKYQPQIHEAYRKMNRRGDKRPFVCYRGLERDAHRFLIEHWVRQPRFNTPHLFAGFYQIHRAFQYIFNAIIGDSQPIIRLRASIWQSIFTHDMRRFWRVLYNRMGEFPCLILGPSGSGKELVAQAIARSRYIPFDTQTLTFQDSVDHCFFPLNLAALSPTLIESELFGHRKGAFTGAIQNRTGWLEVCPLLGSVFLDEIGEIDGAIQVKLLRVLQVRSFQRLGDTQDIIFKGKIIAATNRDLAEETRNGRFREDLYYRLCSDLIDTPSLREQLNEPTGGGEDQTLYHLVLHIANQLIRDEAEAVALSKQTVDWISENLGPDYPWPGNVRELEQCVRNYTIRRHYTPLARSAPARREALSHDIETGALTADELLGVYCALTYARTGSYQETARRLQIDHRTVKSRIDDDLLARYFPQLSPEE